MENFFSQHLAHWAKVLPLIVAMAIGIMGVQYGGSIPVRVCKGGKVSRRQFKVASAWYAWLVLVIGLVVTGYLSYVARLDIERMARSELESDYDELQFRILSLMAAHKQVLLSGAAMFEAKEAISRAEWRTYFNRVRVDQHFNGIQGLGFALAIPAQQLRLHEDAVRHEGFPDYVVRPGGDRNQYSAITYLEPFEGRNLRAFEALAKHRVWAELIA